MYVYVFFLLELERQVVSWVLVDYSQKKGLQIKFGLIAAAYLQ